VARSASRSERLMLPAVNLAGHRFVVNENPLSLNHRLTLSYFALSKPGRDPILLVCYSERNTKSCFLQMSPPENADYSNATDRQTHDCTMKETPSEYP